MRALKIITGHVIYNPAYTYKFQLKTNYNSQKYIFLFTFQAANDPNLMKRRLWRYLLPVLFTSIAINTTKFFELEMVTLKNGDYSFTVSGWDFVEKKSLDSRTFSLFRTILKNLKR